jgi:hypothetical protein
MKAHAERGSKDHVLLNSKLDEDGFNFTPWPACSLRNKLILSISQVMACRLSGMVDDEEVSSQLFHCFI